MHSGGNEGNKLLIQADNVIVGSKKRNVSKDAIHSTTDVKLLRLLTLGET
jgi:hypothetical protein